MTYTPVSGHHVHIMDTENTPSAYLGLQWTVEHVRARLSNGQTVTHLVSTDDAREGKAAMRRMDNVPAAVLVPAADTLADRMRAELAELIADGTVPENVRDFSELHDYIDANMLGDEWLPQLGEESTDEDFDRWHEIVDPITEQAQAIMNRWLVWNHVGA